VFSKNNEPAEMTDLDKLITKHIEAMDGIGPETEEYAAQAANLKVLMETRAIEVEKIDPKPWRPSADAVVAAGASILGIVAILSFEKANVLTSKALTFAVKPKI
jgi:hypothetical protein